ncbi:acetoacetate--CoA ligase [Robertmurraya yapensis]|uniref:Acetoacetate--CoA ligase n=2 Tax=Bacillaceae TaxID=186817 RepID=A0A3S0IM26_9BACI|nr:acetoacetate--CoA ligase [Bacillus yapensis]RTR27144.1 acetoacetate--CoA ligase [Bacillus yapensis]TKS93991.1 acetoacetate--CoA ligase [Bacillus yapensis]
MSQLVKEGSLLWEPSENFKEQSQIVDYMKWLKENRNLEFEDYESLWAWSVTEIGAFWETLWEYFEIQSSTPYLRVLSDRAMPGAKWFEGARLNYVEQVFRNRKGNDTAIISRSELRPLQTTSWKILEEKVAAFAAGLKANGIKSGDRVVAYIPNIPEATIAFLACASIGAVWSSCSPDFGSPTVIARFKQIEPKILIAVDGYRYGGKDFDRVETVSEIQKAITSLEKTILLPYLNESPEIEQLENVVLWEDFINVHIGASFYFEQVPFDHPLWVLYSSGTTGLPKAIVQGHGGILLEHLKQCGLHMNLQEGDRFFWFTTTGWMMWNIVVGGLLNGSTILLFDGNPGYPSLDTLWRFAEETKMTVFGTSASFILSCMNSKIAPANFDLSHLRAIGSTGSPLPPEGFAWVYDHVKRDLWLASVSGGTDICSAFVGGSPILPVRAGEIQCRELGAKVEAYDEAGKSVVDEVGELVLTEPMPSMPLFFWNDTSGERYYSSYFDMYPGVWRHGDWIKVTSTGSCQIYGRSDSTINRGGIRMGTSEIYSAVEGVEGVKDSLVIDLSNEQGSGLLLFIVLEEGTLYNEGIEKTIKERVRVHCSPRHVPDEIMIIKEVPRTLNGKKLEVPIKKILTGVPFEKAVNKGSLSNPDSLEIFLELAGELRN